MVGGCSTVACEAGRGHCEWQCILHQSLSITEVVISCMLHQCTSSFCVMYDLQGVLYVDQQMSPNHSSTMDDCTLLNNAPSSEKVGLGCC
jgi:hypothetical protein